MGGTYFYSKDGVTIADQDEEGAEKYNVLPTAFPSAINVACTWDTDLMYAYVSEKNRKNMVQRSGWHRV